jgi:hypothetical protein
MGLDVSAAMEGYLLECPPKRNSPLAPDVGFAARSRLDGQVNKI